MFHYFHVLKLCFFAFFKKFYYFFILLFNLNLHISNVTRNDVVVSLTSYGRRLEKCAPYTIISILKQKIKPEVIVLNLDAANWNEENIPWTLKKLKKYGLIIQYTEDNDKSFKKLLPTLILYPDKKIITVDDDIFYSDNLVEILLSNYKVDQVVTIKCQIPMFVNDKLANFNEWFVENRFKGERKICALGYGGVLYPENIFTNEVFNREVYKKICPLADDIWFYLMEILNGKSVVLANNYNKVVHYPLNLIYERLHSSKDGLTQANVFNNMNNKQFWDVFNYYKMNFNMFK